MMKIWKWMTGGLVGGSSAHATEHPIPERKSIMAKKAPNYSPELTDAIVADYQAGKPVEDIADAIGKSVRSVRSKLVREGVYVAKEKPQGSKRDNGPTKKELLGRLEEVDPNAPLGGLMGATKEAISWAIDTAEAAADNG
jgi:hypothetical protein